MLRIQQISRFKIPPLVKLSFEGDRDLLEKYHVTNEGLEASVESTVGRINDTSKEYEVKCFKVLYKKQQIGYFVVGKDFLYSFAIAIKFRKKEILKSFWEEIKGTLRKGFMCMLYRKNERAINFLKTNGMIIYDEDDNLVTLINT